MIFQGVLWNLKIPRKLVLNNKININKNRIASKQRKNRHYNKNREKNRKKNERQIKPLEVLKNNYGY